MMSTLRGSRCIETAHPDCAEQYYVGLPCLTCAGSQRTSAKQVACRHTRSRTHAPTLTSSERTMRAVSTPHHVLPPGPRPNVRCCRPAGAAVRAEIGAWICDYLSCDAAPSERYGEGFDERVC